MVKYNLALLRGAADYGASLTQDIDPLGDLGSNERFRADIALAGFLAELPGDGIMPRAVVSSVINAEAGYGTWNPNIENPKSKALGLTQFLKGTWRDQAIKSGTFLNLYAREAGYVNGKRITDDKGLLALRTDPTLSIVAAAQYDAEVFSQLTKRGLIPASLTQDQMAQYLYKGHHEGYEGARQMLSGTLPNDASTKRKFDQNVLEKKQQDYLNKYKEVN